MKCDKCGFEHNSRSVCPKCGARVVYVNEDYLKRRQEWEEAQKKGRTENALPPGIMHSTKEEYEAGRTRKKEGRSETTGLSFDVVKKKLITGIAVVITFFKKLTAKDKRKRSPVVRKIEFDDGKHKLDESPLVLSHKKFGSRLKKAAIIGGSVFLLLAAIVTALICIKKADHSRIFYYDGVNGYVVGEKKPVFEDVQNLMFFQGEGAFLAINSEKVLVYGTKLYEYELANPRIVTCNDDFSAIIGSTDDGIFFLKNGTATRILEKGNYGYSDGSLTSLKGKYAALVTCEEKDDQTISTLYMCKNDGTIGKIDEISGEINVKCVTDTGKIWYERMSIGRYGVINQTDLIFYADEKKIPVCLNVSDSLLSDGKIWYISEKGRLYATNTEDLTDNSEYDSDVLGIQLNHYPGNSQVIYTKLDGYYLSDTAKCIISSDNPSMEVYYQPQKQYALGVDTDKAFYVRDCGAKASEITNISLKKDTRLVCLEKTGELLLINSEEQLLCLDGKTTTFAESVKSVRAVENSTYFVFFDGVSGMLKKKTGASPKQLSENLIELKNIVFSRGKFYTENMSGELCVIGKNGKTKKKIQNVREWFLLKP